LLVTACSDDPAGPPGPPTVSGESTHDVSLVALTRRVDGLFARSSDDIFAISQLLLHYDGSQWRPLEWPRGVDFVRHVWTLANGDIMLHDYYWIRRFNGQVWDYIRAPYGSETICGLPSGEIYMGNFEGIVSFYDGAAWSSEQIATGSIRYIDALSREQVHAVSSPNTLYWRRDNQWVSEEIPGIEGMYAVRSEPDGSAYILCRINDVVTVVHWTPDDGVQPLDIPASVSPEDLLGDASHLYLVGRNGGSAVALRSDRQGAWQPLLVERSPIHHSASTPTGELVVSHNEQIEIANETTSRTLLTWTDEYVRSLWCAPDGNILTAGYRVRMLADGKWTLIPRDNYPPYDIEAFDGTSSSDFYAVGPEMILHYQNDAWEWEGSGFGSTLLDICISGRDRFAVGTYGRIMAFDGQAWVKEHTGITTDLLAIDARDGLAFAVGRNGVILQRVGDAWRTVVSPHAMTLRDVHVFAANHAVAVGDDPAVMLVFDGSTWRVRRIESFTSSDYGFSVATTGNTANDYYVAQSDGSIHHYFQGRWTALPVVTGRVQDMSTAPNGDVLVLGQTGIVRYSRR
jgi:hypothetical protein